MRQTNFVYVRRDETYMWDEEFLEHTGKIYDIYVVNLLEHTYLCEMTPSYWLEYVDWHTEKYIPEDEAGCEVENTLHREAPPPDYGIYVHVSDFERAVKNGIIEIHETGPADEDVESEEDYRHYVDRLIEDYRGNPVWC